MLQATHDLLDHVVGFYVVKGAVCVLQNQAYTDAFSALIYPFASIKVKNLTPPEGVAEHFPDMFS